MSGLGVVYLNILTDQGINIMMSVLFTIWVIHTIALVLPGANLLFLSYIAASDKRTSAIYASFGIALGAIIWSSMAALGVSSLFDIFPLTKWAVQIIGALYLLYLSTQFWFSQKTIEKDNRLRFTPFRAFRKGLLVNLTNPKAALFFGGIFSATFPTNASSSLYIAAVILLAINCLVWHLLFAYFFSTKNAQEIYIKFEQLIGKTASAIFGALGLLVILRTIKQANS